MKTIFICLLFGLNLVQAQLIFEKESQTLTPSLSDESVVADYTFTNSSPQPVTILKADADCSCTTAMIAGGKMTYAPGEKGTIRATIAISNLSGKVDKDVKIWLKDGQQTKYTLKTSIDIPAIFDIQPRTIKWSIGEKIEPKTIDITIKGEQAVHILKVQNNNPEFKYELKSIKDGKHYQLIVTAPAAQSPMLNIMRLETDCAIKQHQVQQVFMVIQPAAKPSPAKK